MSREIGALEHIEISVGADALMKTSLLTILAALQSMLNQPTPQLFL